MGHDTGMRPWKSFNVLPFAVPNPDVANLTASELQEFLAAEAHAAGVRNLVIALSQQDMEVDEKLEDPAWSRWMGRPRGDEQHLRRLRRFRQIEALWNLSRSFTAGEAYDRVILTSEDVHWLGDLQIAHFSGWGAVYARRHGGLCNPSWREPGAIDDRLFVLDGRAAELFMRPYTNFYHHRSVDLNRAANVEEFFELLARALGLRLEAVPKSMMPFAVSLHLHHSKWGDPKFCLRNLGASAEPAVDCIDGALVLHDSCEGYMDHFADTQKLDDMVSRVSEKWEMYGRDLMKDFEQLFEGKLGGG